MRLHQNYFSTLATRFWSVESENFEKLMCAWPFLARAPLLSGHSGDLCAPDHHGYHRWNNTCITHIIPWCNWHTNRRTHTLHPNPSSVGRIHNNKTTTTATDAVVIDSVGSSCVRAATSLTPPLRARAPDYYLSKNCLVSVVCVWFCEKELVCLLVYRKFASLVG